MKPPATCCSSWIPACAGMTRVRVSEAGTTRSGVLCISRHSRAKPAPIESGGGNPSPEPLPRRRDGPPPWTAFERTTPFPGKTSSRKNDGNPSLSVSSAPRADLPSACIGPDGSAQDHSEVELRGSKYWNQAMDSRAPSRHSREACPRPRSGSGNPSRSTNPEARSLKPSSRLLKSPAGARVPMRAGGRFGYHRGRHRGDDRAGHAQPPPGFSAPSTGTPLVRS